VPAPQPPAWTAWAARESMFSVFCQFCQFLPHFISQGSSWGASGQNRQATALCMRQCSPAPVSCRASPAACAGWVAPPWPRTCSHTPAGSQTLVLPSPAASCSPVATAAFGSRRVHWPGMQLPCRLTSLPCAAHLPRMGPLPQLPTWVALFFVPIFPVFATFYMLNIESMPTPAVQPPPAPAGP
jgi:hypothetical protein